MIKPTATLPDTLAQRVQYLREQRGITLPVLARLALITEDDLRDIEQGITLFLAPHMRQMLCRVLRVKPHVLEDVEKPMPVDDAAGPGTQGLSAVEQLAFLQALLNDLSVDLVACPRCNEVAQVQRFDRVDMHNQPVHAIKVRCPKCWLKLDHG